MRHSIYQWLSVVAASSIVGLSAGCARSDASAVEFTTATDTLQVNMVDNVPQVKISLRSNADTLVRCAIYLIRDDKTAALDTINVPPGYRGEVGVYISMNRERIEGSQLSLQPIADSLPATVYALKFE